mmetsp:Transcript_5375/g.7549  ORF Transcript_5375/g.7549 Transcript_5375/m.7549 type:complete len:163 (-) Transcript_5375:28-516(-)
MSHSRKHLKTSALSSFPVPNDVDKVAQVTELRGGNVCQIRFPDSSVTLCQIPNKFRKLIWIKKGNYVLVREPKILSTDRKIRAQIEHVLFPDQIKHIQQLQLWPQEFVVSEKKVEETSEQNPDDDELLQFNPNHQVVADSDEEDENEDEEDEESSDVEEDQE